MKMNQQTALSTLCTIKSAETKPTAAAAHVLNTADARSIRFMSRCGGWGGVDPASAASLLLFITVSLSVVGLRVLHLRAHVCGAEAN